MSKEKESFELALALITQHFDLSELGDEVIIDEDASREIESGWVICYNSKAFLETGDFNKMLMGNKPVLVDHQGNVEFVAPDDL